jgi:hypothetical protein
VAEAQPSILKILDKPDNKERLVIKLEENNPTNKDLNLEIVQLLPE